MRHFMKGTVALVAAFILFAGWAAFAQVQEKPKAKLPATTKPAPAALKASADTAKKPAEAAKSAPAAAKDATKPAAADKSSSEP